MGRTEGTERGREVPGSAAAGLTGDRDPLLDQTLVGLL